MNERSDFSPTIELETNILSKDKLIEKYKNVRAFTRLLCKPLVTEDYVIQSMPDVSPTKWHLAHTSWFFETFILKKAASGYKPLNPEYNFLFNSYYVLVGKRHTRAFRGLLSRPTVKDVYYYREYVDQNMTDFLDHCSDEQYKEYAPIVEIGLHHEQQHQELMLTDIKHVFSVNPLNPAYIEKSQQSNIIDAPSLEWIDFNGGLVNIGYNGNGFAYDNETPMHKEYIEPFKLASRLITNGEYLKFIEANGYERPELWLSDGFATVEREKWNAPMYWEKLDGEWWEFKLTGISKVNLSEPVCHISHYEADAYATWVGARLPTEAEWEVAAEGLTIEGNFVEDGNYNPIMLNLDKGKNSLHQMFGDVWEWTRSPYTPYPGFKTLPGALGEYNGKFMSNQMVLRGGSCATSKTHIRKTYRNFFPPNARWQFMGFRLAKDNRN